MSQSGDVTIAPVRVNGLDRQGEHFPASLEENLLRFDVDLGGKGDAIFVVVCSVLNPLVKGFVERMIGFEEFAAGVRDCADRFGE